VEADDEEEDVEEADDAARKLPGLAACGSEEGIDCGGRMTGI